MAWYDKKRKHWVADHWVKGKRLSKRGFNSKRAARDYESEEEKKLKKGRSLTPPATGFREIANQYLDQVLAIEMTPTTYSGKARAFRGFLSFMGGDIPFLDVLPFQVDQYLATVPGSNYNKNCYRKELHTLWQWYKKKFLRPDIINPVSATDIRDHQVKRKRNLTEEEVILMIDASKPGEERAFFVVMLHTWARPNEVCRLKWSDVNFDRMEITLWTRKRKGGRLEQDTLPMNRALAGELQSLERKSESVFINKKTGRPYKTRTKLIYKIARKAKIEPIEYRPRKTRHGIRQYAIYPGWRETRRYMAQRARQKDAPMAEVSFMLRHREQRTTEDYLANPRMNVRRTAELSEDIRGTATADKDESAIYHICSRRKKRARDDS
jgi:integrase